MARTSVIPPDPAPHESLAARGATLVPSSPSERADLLDSTEWSRRLAWADLATLAGYLRLYRLAPGKVLFTEGEHDSFLALIVAGELEIHKHDSADQDHPVARVGKGKVVGEMSLLDKAARSATGIAAEPTELLILTRAQFDELGRAHPSAALAVTTAIATSIAQLLRQTTGALVEHLDRGEA
jgi:CRP/FNR family cyclic AMP-dependent transcriptional regulator